MESFIHYILENSLFEQILTSLEIASLGVARQTVALGQPCFLVLFPLAIFCAPKISHFEISGLEGAIQNPPTN